MEGCFQKQKNKSEEWRAAIRNIRPVQKSGGLLSETDDQFRKTKGCFHKLAIPQMNRHTVLTIYCDVVVIPIALAKM